MNRIAKACALAVLLCASAALNAQEYSFRTFGDAEGLNNLAVRQIYQDHVGFIWVDTDNGIFRYDGESFEAFGQAQGMPPNSRVYFGDAPDGSLLVGGEFGLYQQRGNRFEKVAVNFKRVESIQGYKTGHTLIGTELGLIQFTFQPGKKEFSQYLFPRQAGASGPEAFAVLVDGDTVWYGCGLELCRMDSHQKTVFGRESGLPALPVVALQKDRDGNLWLSIKREGVFVKLAGQTKFRRPDLPARTLTTINPLGIDADGRIVLPTPDGLLIRDGNAWKKVGQPQGLRGAAYTVMEDRQHSLWIGTVGRGLVQWQGYGEWETYSSASGLGSDLAWQIQPQADGSVLVGTGTGLLHGVRKVSGMTWSKVAGLDGFSVRGLRSAPNGDLWVGTETHGAARLTVRTGKIVWYGEERGLRSKGAYAICFDRQQRLWVATEVGIFTATAPYARFSRVAELPSTHFWTVEVGSDGLVWAGGYSGLFALTGEHWKIFKQADGLSNQAVLSLGAGPNGTMWVGYEFGGGIDRVHLQSGRLAVEKGVQRPGTDGLVYFLNFDASGRLWAGTEHGVDVWDGSRWSHYDTSDGLAWNDCNVNAFAAEPDGTVWIGTSGGLSRFKPRLRQKPDAPLQVVFTKLLIGGVDVSGRSNTYSSVQANSLRAGYSAFNASRDNEVVFRYRLQEAGSAWTETTRRELQFAKLGAGKYRLQIEAREGDGVWSTHGAEFAFRIPAPWYLSWWFFTICALIPLSAAWGVMRIRLARLNRREREFKRLHAAHEEIRNLAFYDPLTALPNRRLLSDRLEKTLTACASSGRLCALLFVDLDNFKMLNDTLGHQIGDMLLQEVARRLTISTRGTDFVARLGGDEFVVMLEDLNEIPERAAARAESMARKILEVTSLPYLLAGRECRSTSSIGVTIFGHRHESIKEVMQQADIAMYQAKSVGRNTIRFFAPALQAAVNARASMEADLHQAVMANQFVLYYQPQIDDGRLVGAEALVRWNHPKRGILLPGEFIHMAEETGLILQLGDWVLETACRQLASWATAIETAHITVSVNISAWQFRQVDFVERVLKVLKRTGANPQSLKLELTESVLVDNVEDVIAKMMELRTHGLRFSLDDFGTGYSSLAYLKRLPLDQLKIDRCFVRDILADPTSGAIAQTIVSLSRAMGLSVIAEGVETEKQRIFLAHLGCHSFQGFLFSRPIPVEEFALLLPQFAAA